MSENISYRRIKEIGLFFFRRVRESATGVWGIGFIREEEVHYVPMAKSNTNSFGDKMVRMSDVMTEENRIENLNRGYAG